MAVKMERENIPVISVIGHLLYCFQWWMCRSAGDASTDAGKTPSFLQRSDAGSRVVERGQSQVAWSRRICRCFGRVQSYHPACTVQPTRSLSRVKFFLQTQWHRLLLYGWVIWLIIDCTVILLLDVNGLLLFRHSFFYGVVFMWTYFVFIRR